MRFSYVSFCGLDNVEIPSTISRGDRFLDDYYITNDRKFIKELVIPYVGEIGYVEYEYICNRSDAVIYRKDQVDNANSDIDITPVIRFQNRIDMMSAKSLLASLWVIKDSSCNFDRFWSVGKSQKGNIVHCNNWPSQYYQSNGKIGKVSFTALELKNARAMAVDKGVSLHDVDQPTLLFENTIRFHRFGYYVNIARTSADLAMKIANYCSALEALVSSVQQELSHQVSERVSSLIAEPGDKRIKVFSAIKKAYGLRSKFVHGSSFKSNDISILSNQCIILDRICRSLCILYLDKKSDFKNIIKKTEPAFSEHFVRISIGGERGIYPEIDLELDQ